MSPTPYEYSKLESQSAKTSASPPSPKTIVSEPLWQTKEFYFHYAVIAAAFVLFVTEGMRISSPEHPNYDKFAHRLQDGWMFGRKVDNSDFQFATFRNNFALLLTAASGYLVLSHVVRHFSGPATPPKSPTRKLYRAYFFLAFSLAFLTFLHGASVIKILALVSGNYAIAKICKGTKWGPAATWTYNLIVLFANETYRGYSFSAIDERLEILDRYNGLARWHVTFNISMLRMVSFNMDYYWMHHVSSKLLPKDDRDEGPLTEKDRITSPCTKVDYNFVNYLAYILYTPLYLAGPIITFNSFISQLRRPSNTITIKSTALYAARVFSTIMVMESILHFIYVVAISKEKAWEGYTPLQISLVGWWNLKLIWLKLTIIWRFFRLWAMADGIDAPENMIRCMTNNYSAQGFWRSWHRSFNRWLIRYVYVPLGGSKYAKYNIWVVFTFVALWHDISLNLLAWGWLICLFLLPEMLCTAYFGRPKFRRWKYYRHFAAMGGVMNCMMMLTANLVGFAVGLDGVKEMFTRIFSWEGTSFLIGTIVVSFSTVQVMFEVREAESRRNAAVNM